MRRAMASSQLRTLSSPPRLKSFSACAARFLIVLIMFKLAYSFDRSNPFGQMVWRYGIQRARSWLVSDRCVQKPRVNRDTMRFGSVVPIGPLAIASIALLLCAFASNMELLFDFLRMGLRTGDSGSRSRCASPFHRLVMHLSWELRSATSKNKISRNSTWARLAF